MEVYGFFLIISYLVKITVKYCWRIIFALPKVVLQHFIGEVRKFITFWCQVSSGCGIPNIIKISLFFTGIFNNKNKKRTFWNIVKYDKHIKNKSLTQNTNIR